MFILKFSVCVFFILYFELSPTSFLAEKNVLEYYKLLGRKDYWHGWFLRIIMLTYCFTLLLQLICVLVCSFLAY